MPRHKPTLLSLIGLIGCGLASALYADEHEPEDPQPGSFDQEFSGPSFNSEVTVIARDAERFLVGGAFTNIGPRIASILPDGGVDPAFSPGTGASGTVRSIAVGPEGLLYIGGDFTEYAGQTRNRVARLNADGSLDTDFNPGAGLNSRVNRVVPLPDGKVLVAGAFWQVHGQSILGIARLDADGSLDGGFQVGTGTNHTVNDVLLLDDGRAVIGGLFQSYNGIPRSRIAVLNPDGTLDESFEQGSGFNGPVTSLLRTANGKILVAGTFSAYNGQPSQRMALLNPDGTLDQSFNPGMGPSGSVLSMAEDSSGRFILGGTFTGYDEHPLSNIARIRPNGAVDEPFDPGDGALSTVNSVVDLSDEERILIGGVFTHYDGHAAGRFARIIGGGELEEQEGYYAWLAQFFTASEIANPAITGPGADPDFDGMPNIGEYAFGGNPTVPLTAPRPVVSRENVGGVEHLRIAFVRRQEAWDVRYDVQAAPTPAGPWTDVWSSAGNPYNSSQEQITQTVQVEASAEKQFLRVFLFLDESAGPPPPPDDGYYAWLERFFTATEIDDSSITGPGADPDFDGVPNIGEYAFGGDPTVPLTAPRPVVSRVDVGGVEHLRIAFVRRQEAWDVRYDVQAAPTLAGPWTDVWSSAGNPYNSSQEQITQEVQVEASADKQFLRVVLFLDESAGPPPPPPEGGLEDWLESYFSGETDAAIVGEDADPSGDGVANLLVYAFNGNPTVPNRGILPQRGMVEDNGDRYLTITFTRVNGADDIVYRVESSSTLDTETWNEIWNSDAHPFEGTGATASVTVQDPEPIGNGGKRFLRVNVTRQ